MRRYAHFILSMSGGVLILVGGIVSLIWLLIDFPPTFDPLFELRENLGKEEFRLFQIRYTVAGISTGVAVIMTSYMLRIAPHESKRWGIMIIALSAMSILGMGGFVIGMALGIAGGVLAVKRSRELVTETEEKKPAQIIMEDENMIFKCSSCNIIFKSNEELKNHVIRSHMR